MFVTLRKEGENLIIELETPIMVNMPDEFKPYFDMVDTILGMVEEKEGKTIVKPVFFTHLHTHTQYSLLDGATKPKDLANKTSDCSSITIEDGKVTNITFGKFSPISAITDHGNIFGAYDFNNALLKKNCKPIIGCEVYAEYAGSKNNHLILLVKDAIGYQNLCKILTKAENNFYRHANVTIDMLKEHHKGLVCMSACLAGSLSRALNNSQEDLAYQFVEDMQDIFGEDFYIEVQNHNLYDELAIRKNLISIAKEFDAKLIATCDSHYLEKEDGYAHEVLLSIGTGSKMDDPSRFKFEGENYHFLNNEEAYSIFKDIPEAIANQAEIIEKCAFVFKKTNVTMPDFEVPEGYTQRDYFEELCKKGFENRFNGNNEIDIKTYTERLDYEIKVIEEMGFEGYFLIVQDFINWAKNRDIAIGPGRGSCVGSLVAYCLNITDLDPIPFDLLFERFLNPERISMPDIDVDIADERRQEVIDYVSNKYGHDHVSRIITFGTMAARMVVKDVGRVMDINQSLIDATAKAIPAEPKMTIEKALKISPELKTLYAENQEIKKVIDVAKRLEGTTRHKSQHACGVIVSKDPIDNTVPEVILEDTNGNSAPTAAFNMVELEDMGLLKMDFLGLRNMSIIKNSVNKIGITEKEINLFDPAVYEFISTGETDGIFQIESEGMKKLMKDIFSDVHNKRKTLHTKEENLAFGHECFERLIAAISLYRPGPMDYIPDYIAGMRDPNAIKYDTPELESILSNTYGVLVYQEQVQQICRKLAGYSLGRSDLIRRAMGKKKQDVMDAEKEIFINGNADAVKTGKEKVLVPGCIANGISPEAATIIWNKMAKFAEYAFNKSHSAGYSVIAVQTAWLKHYYPNIFWVETLNSVISKADKIKQYINTAKKKLNILPPSVNKSTDRFCADEEGIRVGLKALRNLGAASMPILNERCQNGEFDSLKSFIDRTLPDKKALEALAYSGSLDEFGFTRQAIIENVENILKYKSTIQKYDSWADIPEIDEWYRSMIEIEISNREEMPKSIKLQMEDKFTGMYITEHPLDEYADAIGGINNTPISDLIINTEEDEEDSLAYFDEKDVLCIGLLKDVKKIITKKGKLMFTTKLEDQSSSIKVTVFPKETELYENLINENEIVIISGTWKFDEFGSQIVAKTISKFEDIQFEGNQTLFMLTDSFENTEKIINELEGKKYGTEVCFRIKNGDNITTAFYSTSENKLVPRNASRDFGNPDNLKIRLTFEQFLNIKENVQKVAFQKR